MPKTRRVVLDSFKTGSVSPAEVLAAAKRVRDTRGEEATLDLSALYKSAPVLVKKAS